MLAGLFAGTLADSVALAATGRTTGRFVPGVAALPGGACLTSGCAVATVAVRKD